MCHLSVIIVNYNAQHFLQICLDALQDALTTIDAEVIVIDNVSSDNSCTLIKEQYSWVTLIQNTENVGFGKANNQGAAIAKGKHLLILNPDTIVSQHTLKKSLALLDNDASLGAIGVKMLDGGGRYLPESKRGLPRPQVAFYKAFGLTRLFPKSKVFARYYLGHLSPNENQDVEVLAGAYMMIPASVYQQCHGFDEDFFMYGEDIDLSYRITKQGYRLYYLAEHPIIHFKGESTSHDAAWRQRFYGAMDLFSQKHFADKGRLLNHLMQWGIKVHQVTSRQQKQLIPPLKTSSIDVNIIMQHDENSENESFPLSERFLSYKYSPIEAIDYSEVKALAFTPKIRSEQQIKIMQACPAHTLFFFCPNDKKFLLLSPSSQDSGQVIF